MLCKNILVAVLKTPAMKQICFLFILVACSLAVFSQKNGLVKGIAYDTISRKAVAGATITVLVKKESSLLKFSMTDNSGRFFF